MYHYYYCNSMSEKHPNKQSSRSHEQNLKKIPFYLFLKLNLQSGNLFNFLNFLFIPSKYNITISVVRSNIFACTLIETYQ